MTAGDAGCGREAREGEFVWRPADTTATVTRMRRVLGIWMAALALVGSATAGARQAGPATAGPADAASRGITATTRHRGVFDRQEVEYLAAVEVTQVEVASAAPATIVTTSYLRQDVSDAARRPVIFAFNGGPGASSSPLHLSALGPRRYAIDGTGERIMRDNPFSPLDAADLVFVDPVGTGFSKPAPGTDGQPYWSVTGDAASVAAAIEAWLRRHGREASPRFLCGESYGTSRAAEILSAHPALRFDGVLLLSLTGGPADPDEALAMLVPTYAVTAVFHGRADAGSRPPREVFDDAAAFARGEYLTALRLGDELSTDARDRVATELAGRIGLPRALVLERRLRIERDVFMRTLLETRGLRVGQLDTRVTGSLQEFAGRTPPYDDPSMPGAQPFKRPTPHLYFTEELGVQSTDAYVPLNLAINAKWRFDDERALHEPLSLVAEGLRANPRMRVFWMAGLYDLTTPLASGRYLFERSGIPPDGVTSLAAPTGHMPYDGDEALARFTSEVRRFVTATP